MSIDRAQIECRPCRVDRPEHRPPGSRDTKAVPRTVSVEGAKVGVKVVLGYPARNPVRRDPRARRRRAAAGERRRRGRRGPCRRRWSPTRSSAAADVLPNVKNIIAVASRRRRRRQMHDGHQPGARARRGGRVGRHARRRHLRPVAADDARHLGPPASRLRQRRWSPLKGHGIQANSIGFLIEQDNPEDGGARSDGHLGARSSCCARPTGRTWTS